MTPGVVQRHRSDDSPWSAGVTPVTVATVTTGNCYTSTAMDSHFLASWFYKKQTAINSVKRSYKIKNRCGIPHGILILVAF